MTVYVKRKNPGWLESLLKRYGQKAELAIGWPQGTNSLGLRYPDGVPVVLVAAVNTFGSSSRGIPSRPFMQQSAEPAVVATAPVAAAMVKAVNRGKATIEDALKEMGPYAQGAFQTTITDYPWLPNAPSTIAAKGSAKPLIDTSLMRGSITWIVRKPDA